MVAGTGLNYETIHRVAALCAESGAEYLGDVRGTRKAELISGARAVLFPSRLPEGCPLVILEAMFAGTPVISSRNGGTGKSSRRRPESCAPGRKSGSVRWTDR